jgi:2-polyprenyl-3-methyl-5-hydroxy-6-metoxy-1,4-benzoquinol methylase
MHPYGGSLSTMTEDTLIQRCVACGSEQWLTTETWKRYQLAVCSQCELTFTLNPDYHAGRYVIAYEGTSGDGPLPEEQRHIYTQSEQRLKLEARALWVPPPRLTPAEKLALKWLRGHAPTGAVVIDCGCGVGRFQRALQNTTLRAVGVEVSETLVALLNRRGLTAIQGEAPDFPWPDTEPFAITFFEVLEHLPNPAEVMERLKHRFPNAAIIASVPSPLRASLLRSGQRGAADFPPHHFLRWTPKALEIFFKKLDYTTVTVELPSPIGSELMPAARQFVPKAGKGRGPKSAQNSPFMKTDTQRSLLGRCQATAVVWMHRGYQVAMDCVGAPKAWLAARQGASTASMLVIAEP